MLCTADFRPDHMAEQSSGVSQDSFTISNYSAEKSSQKLKFSERYNRKKAITVEYSYSAV